MPEYEWKNENGEVRVTDRWDKKPDEPGDWKRIYSVGIGRVEGAGGGPGMPSTPMRGKRRGNR